MQPRHAAGDQGFKTRLRHNKKTAFQFAAQRSDDVGLINDKGVFFGSLDHAVESAGICAQHPRIVKARLAAARQTGDQRAFAGACARNFNRTGDPPFKAGAPTRRRIKIKPSRQ